jgi:hypothetical protein
MEHRSRIGADWANGHALLPQMKRSNAKFLGFYSAQSHPEKPRSRVIMFNQHSKQGEHAMFKHFPTLVRICRVIYYLLQADSVFICKLLQNKNKNTRITY